MARGRQPCVKCRARPGSGEPRLCEDCWAALDCAIELDEMLDRELWWQKQTEALMLVYPLRLAQPSRNDDEGV